MRIVFGAILLAVSCGLGSGCVTMGKYRALETSLTSTEELVTQQKGIIQASSSELAARQGRIDDLQRQLNDASTEVARLMAEVARLKADLDVEVTRTTTLVSDKGKLSQDIEVMKQALREAEARKAAAEESILAYRDLLSRFQKLIDAGKLSVKIVGGRMVVVLATDVLFASGSADLSPEGVTAVTEVAQVLATMPDRSFQVEGHTDNVPIKTEKYPSNWELAAARSLTVVKAMVKAGMAAGHVSASSYGENQPATSNDSTDGRKSNRRIEIVVVPDLSGLPGYSELQKAGAAQ